MRQNYYIHSVIATLEKTFTNKVYINTGKRHTTKAIVIILVVFRAFFSFPNSAAACREPFQISFVSGDYWLERKPINNGRVSTEIKKQTNKQTNDEIAQ